MSPVTVMTWTERQRAMLEAMGLRVWTPSAPPPVDEVEASRAAVAMAERPGPVPSRAGSGPLPGTPDAPSPGRPPTVSSASDAAPSVAEATRAGPQRPPEARSTEPALDIGSVARMDWPALREAVAGCRACSLCEQRRNTVFGVGHENADWMIVGEAPGEQEDLRGEPFVGKAGQLLDAMLSSIGLGRGPGTPAQQVFIANTLKCRPPRNRNPTPEEMQRCEPFLMRQVALVQPRIILAMGRFAVQALLRSDLPVSRLRGRVHRYEGVPLIVTYHPAYLLRTPEDKARAWEDLCLARAVAAGAAG